MDGRGQLTSLPSWGHRSQQLNTNAKAKEQRQSEGERARGSRPGEHTRKVLRHRPRAGEAQADAHGGGRATRLLSQTWGGKPRRGGRVRAASTSPGPRGLRAQGASGNQSPSPPSPHGEPEHHRHKSWPTVTPPKSPSLSICLWQHPSGCYA